MPQQTKTSEAITPFKKRYASLNEEQKAAVDLVEGPVMVIAGPGTGKTETLGLRVANILQKTQSRPGNILCLTFSTAGAKAMRERLRDIIGASAYGVTVSTIHSFCNEIILGNPLVFEDFRALEQVSRIEQLRIVRRLLHDLPAGSHLGRPVAGTDRAGDVLSRILEMKRESITVSALNEHAKTYKEDIKTTPTGKERDQTSKAYLTDLRRTEQFAEFIDVYEGYGTALHDLHRYDTEDMILVVNQALRENDFLLASLQERYQYILVDEFQDLNGAQSAFLHILTTYENLDFSPNLFVVGDDDQAIYRFQGANVMGMKDFLDRFPQANVLTLRLNYRSDQSILDAASSLIAESAKRLVSMIDGISKDLTAASGQKGSPVLFVRYPSHETELAGMTEMLTELRSDDVSWSDMAVLCRSNAEVKECAKILEVAEIPSIMHASADLFSNQWVLDAIILLRAAMAPDDSVLLSSALRLPIFSIHPSELGKLWIEWRENREERRENREEKSQSPLTLRSYLLHQRADLPTSLKEALDRIEQLHSDSTRLTLPAFIEELIVDSGLFLRGEAVDPDRIAGLHAFFNYVVSRTTEQKSLTLRALLEDIEQYCSDLSLTMQYDIPYAATDGVNLMTAHRSKGLEFAVVCVPHVRRGNWDNRRAPGTLSLPDYLIYERDHLDEKEAKLEDERRLIYVAMTRARKHLILTFPETYPSGEHVRDSQVSEFVAEAQEELTEVTVDPSQVRKPIETLGAPSLDIDKMFATYLQERIEQFELSVTALNTYLRDPEEFLWVHLLRQPQAQKAHLAYGSAIHRALETLGQRMIQGDDISESLLSQLFTDEMQERELFTKRDLEHYLHVGQIVCDRYASGLLSGDVPLIQSTERTLRARLGDIPIKGTIDRVDLYNIDGQQCRVVDYKTGHPKLTQEAVMKDENLYRQLVFYKLLCSESQSFSYDVSECVFAFLGSDREEGRSLSFQIPQGDMDELRKLIEAVWARITAFDFDPISL